MINVLYIHGMGGGGDSRIPWLLRCALEPGSSDCRSLNIKEKINVVVRTYDFDPEVAAEQIASWVEELEPALVIGESLGSLQALRVRGVPHLFVSPSLNAPVYLGLLSWLALIPGVTWIFDRIYHPKPGDRQTLHFTFRILRKYLAHRRTAMTNTERNGSKDLFFAFFGTRDHYRKSGIVSIRTWRRHFGDTYAIYDGTHFMEEEFVYSMLLPKILEVLGINR